MTKPLTPIQVNEQIRNNIPDAVIQAFNRCPVQYGSTVSREIIFTQSDVVASIMEATGSSRAEVFENGWLNIESHFAAAGWKVEYLRQDIGDTVPPHFRFTY